MAIAEISRRIDASRAWIDLTVATMAKIGGICDRVEPRRMTTKQVEELLSSLKAATSEIVDGGKTISDGLLELRVSLTTTTDVT